VPVRSASGQSQSSETREAVQEAVNTALRRLGEAPTLGVLFASSKHELGLTLETARSFAPTCAFIGSSTASEFTENGKTSGGIVVLLTTLDPRGFALATATGVKEDPVAAARALTAPFAGLLASNAKRGLALSTSVLLVDGLAGTGEKLVREVLAGTRSFQQIVGGAAGDDGRFVETRVGTHERSGTDSAAVLHTFGRTPWGVGVGHGLSAQSQRMVATRAKGNVLYELDGRPAIEAYRAHAAKKGVTLDDANTGKYLIGNELGVFIFKELHHTRAPVGVGPNGELQLVAEIAQGAQVCILDGNPDAMVAAAGRAAEEALQALQGTKPAGVLVFDCICRGMILDRDFQREIDAIRAHFPATPIAGFLTYGEIARFRGRLDGWHNTTSVVVAIPE
jgi:hypothetical protein